MARPTKMTPNITKKIGDNIALGLSYFLAAEAVGITYQTFNSWMNRGKTEKSGKYHQFYKYINKCNADAAKKCLEHLNKAANAETARFACGFWKDVSRRILVDICTEKWTSFQRIKTKMLR